jgi:transmembrane sensor
MLSEKDKKRFQKLIRKYLEGKASASEAEFVESYYRHFDGREMEASLYGERQQAIEDHILEQLNGRMDQAIRMDRPEPGTIVPLYRKPVLRAAAAAAVLLLAAGSHWYFGGTTNKQQARVQTLKADIAPGGNKATLTLANGQTVILDSLSNGSLAQQGHSTVMKLAGGQVAYVAQPGNNDQANAGGGRPGENRGNEGPALYNTLTTPIGGQYKITLPDGTRAWLNSESSIRYPTAFTGQERRVEVTGEAYFEIKENPHMPFTVEARGTSVQVLGTHFNVMAYGDEASVNTTLLEGKVRVLSAKGTAVLKPGEKAIVSDASPGISVMEADTDRETAWIDGFFEFDQTDLPTLMRQLKRWYGIQPVYQSNGNGRLFGGRINRNLNLSEALHLLEGNGIHFSIEGKKLIVLP